MPFKESTEQRKKCVDDEISSMARYEKKKSLLKDEEEWHEMGQKDLRKAPAEYKLGDEDWAVTSGPEVLRPCVLRCLLQLCVLPAFCLSPVFPRADKPMKPRSARESLQTATVLCRVTAKVKLGSVFTACQVLLGQTGLPDNPRDAFLNYRVLSAPAGLREGHAPSLPCIPRGWQCRCCGPSSLDLGNDACLRHRTQGVSQPFRSNCCFNQYSSQTWMWHWGKIGIGYTRAGFETKGIQVMMLS